MNIWTHRWQPELLEHCGGRELINKLSLEPVEGGVQLGNINPYYVQRYGFSPGKENERNLSLVGAQMDLLT